MLLDATFLVPPAKARAFRTVVAGAGRRLAPAGYRVILTGPWPPVQLRRRGVVKRRAAARRGRRAGAARLLARPDPSLLDLVDNVLTKGVVVDGEVVLGLADVDLIYLRLAALLCAADRVSGDRA